MTNSPFPNLTPGRPTPRPRTRSAFTLVELLTVVSIIALLLAISIWGYRHLNRSSKDNLTRSTLTSLRAWTTELEASTAQSGGATKGFAVLNDSTAALPAYQKVTIAYGAAGAVPLRAATNLGDMSLDSVDVTNPARGRYGPAIKQTAIIMGRLMRLPANKTAIEKMPAERILTKYYGPPLNRQMPWNPFGYSGSGDPNPIPGTSPPVYPGPVIVDGYGNPIVFVPSAGMSEVDRGGQYGIIIDGTSVGPIRSRDDKPFWASAGVDGKFTGVPMKVPPIPNPKPLWNQGDDNLYSFDQ